MREGPSGRGVAVVLFTDLVGSTELRGRLGEEATDEVRRRHDRLLTDAVRASDGKVVKGLGDGIMAVFSGASDAVAAAVAIQQAVDRLNRSGKTPVPLAVRVGLSAGDVAFEDDDVHGTPVIEASRLCAHAAGGEILAAGVVRILAGSTGGHGYVSVGSLELKGLGHPVAAVRVEWEPKTESRIPMPALLTDVGRIFVGRDDELECLGRLWKEAVAGERRVALLAGEPGVGKTRLAAELAIRVDEEGGVVLAGRCDEDLGVPYQPFVEALRHFIDHTPSDELKERLGRYGAELARLVPELTDQVPGLLAPLQSDPETERYRLFDAVAAWLSAASADEPLLLLLDDMQWAAKPTLLLLRHVVRASDVRRLLILGTYRDTDLTHDHPLTELLADLRRDGAIERLPLSGLDDGAVAAYVEHAAGHALDDDGWALARAIYQETEGNPFFVREVLRHLAETNVFERDGGRWITRVPIDELGIPEGVRDVVGRRLSRLSSSANQVLRVAAVMGPEFEAEVVRTAAEIPENDLLTALDEAAEARLISEVSPIRFRFSHAVVRATLYESLSGARKVMLHRAVAHALEAIHEGALDNYLPALAHHWARASAPAADTARAVDYAVRAGDQALAQLAHDEAAAYYRQALELLDASGGAVDDGHRAELLIALGEAQRRAGDPAHRETLLAAARLALNAGDVDRLTRAALANHRGGGLFSVIGSVDAERVAMLEAAAAAQADQRSPVRAHLLAQLAGEIVFAGDPDRTRQLAHEALDLIRGCQDALARARVLMPIANAIWSPDRIDDRMTVSAELLAATDVVGDPVLSFWANVYRALIAFEVPDGAEASRSVATLCDLAGELRQPVLEWMSGIVTAALAAAAGRFNESEELAVAAYRLGMSIGQLDAAVYLNGNQFAVRFHQGRLGDLGPDLDRAAAAAPALGFVWLAIRAVAHSEVGEDAEARRLFETAMALVPDHPKDLTWLPCVTRLAMVCARLGDIDRALEISALLTPYQHQAAATGAGWAGSVSHFLGMLETVLGQFEEASDHFARAEAMHDRFGSPPWTARTRLEWGQMLLTRHAPGDAERARELLGQALATARTLGLTGIERRAVGLLT